jgi:PAS domain S-box-containing protein
MGDGHRILVVDDELGPREALRMILKSKYQVMTAVNGPDALECIAKMPPDIVLLDIRMRQMNGIQVLQAIKQIDPTIEVIMITAYASLATAREAIAYEALEYLTKPFSKQEVERAVEKAIARRDKRTGARREIWTLLEHMRTLAYASSTAVGQHDLLQSASGLLDQGKRLFDSTAAVLYILEEPSRHFVCKVVLGAAMQQRGAFEREDWTAPLSQILRAHQPLILPLGQVAPPYDGMARALNALGYRGGAFFPMLAGDEEVGVLAFLYESPREFRREWTHIGRTIAELMALSIHTHQRYYASKQEAVQQAQRVAQLSILREVSRIIVGKLELAETLKAIGDQLQAGLGYAGFYVWLYRRDGTQLHEAYGSGPHHGWQPGDADRSPPCKLQVERFPDAHVVLAPIVLEGTTVGLIKLVREAHQGPVAELEIELLCMLLDYIGLAIQNSQLYGEIKETKSYLESLINGAGDAIITVDREDRVTSWNDSAKRIFQYQDWEIRQQKIWTLVPRELYEQWQDEVLQGGGVKHIEACLRQRNGMPIDASLTLSPLRGPCGEIVGLSAIIKDVTEEKQLRERLLQSEKLRSLGEMAAGIAHNFNNILTAILGQTRLLAYYPGDVEAVQKGLVIMGKAAEDGVTTVQRLQKFARGVPTSEFTRTDLNQVVKEAIAATQPIWKDQAGREGRPVEMVMELGTIAPVHGRSSELREVLVNMILNAVGAMPKGGRLTLCTRQGEGSVYVEVSDTGIGMTEGVRRRIFNPFYTTKGASGTGLGLSVSYMLIKSHNGDIEVRSNPGRGTTFSIKLPSEPGPTESPTPGSLVGPLRPDDLLSQSGLPQSEVPRVRRSGASGQCTQL